jgi:gliding motility-associated-like protein
LNDSLFFTDHSAVASGTISAYQWDLGDGTTSSASNPVHAYAGSGTFPVALTVTSDSGCVNTTSAVATVYPLPAAGFLHTAVCYGDTTTFTNQSNVANDTINFWLWDFGDGTTASGENQHHIYSSFGNYPVQLIVRTQHGCPDTIVNPVTVNPLPVAEAGSDTTVCSGSYAVLGISPVNGVNYQWSPDTLLDFPSSSSTSLYCENNTLTILDLYYTLTAVNSFGCTGSDNVHVRIKPLPALDFEAPPPQCLKGNRFTFTPQGHTDANSALSWNFGSNSNPPSSPAVNPPAVFYSTAGSHIVTLLYSYMGCPAPPVTDSVLVWEMPVAGFAPSPFEGCTPVDVTCYNLHTDTSYEYTWIIQGQTFHEVNPSWTFEQPGNYTITQIVKNQYGCQADPEKATVHVYPIPEADFTNSPDSAWIYRSLIEFENKSTGASFYSWDFGDGTTDNFFSGSHNYTDTGTFDITLIVISDHGCRDTVYGKVRVYEGFSFYVPNAFTPNGDGVNDSFQGYGTFLHSYEMWIYDRWGLLIYHTDDYDKPWDGRMNTLVQNDTYVYRIRVTDYTDKEHIFLGSVTLVR